MGRVRRRLKVLEGRIPPPKLPDRTEARARMKAHLDQVAKLRRSELSDEEAAEVEAVSADMQRYIAKRRGEIRNG